MFYPYDAKEEFNKKLLLHNQEYLKSSQVEMEELSPVLRFIVDNLNEFFKQKNSIEIDIQVLSALIQFSLLKDKKDVKEKKSDGIFEKYPNIKALSHILSENVKFYSSQTNGQFDFLQKKDDMYVNKYVSLANSLFFMYLCNLEERVKNFKIRQDARRERKARRTSSTSNPPKSLFVPTTKHQENNKSISEKEAVQQQSSSITPH